MKYKLSDSIRWHIKSREKESEKEAKYIAKIIKIFESKFKEKYRLVLDVCCVMEGYILF